MALSSSRTLSQKTWARRAVGDRLNGESIEAGWWYFLFPRGGLKADFLPGPLALGLAGKQKSGKRLSAEQVTPVDVMRRSILGRWLLRGKRCEATVTTVFGEGLGPRQPLTMDGVRAHQPRFIVIINGSIQNDYSFFLKSPCGIGSTGIRFVLAHARVLFALEAYAFQPPSILPSAYR